MEKYITELLDNNVRVVLPDLGAFIVKQRKPLKIIFNEFLKYNDGLLIEYIAKTDNLSKDDSTKKVSEYVDSIKEKLNKNENILVAGLGILSKDSSGNIVFDLSKDSLVKTETEAPKAEKKEKAKEAEVKEEKKEAASKTKPAAKKEEPKKEEPKVSVMGTSSAAQNISQDKKSVSSSEPNSYKSGRYTKQTSDDEKKRAWLWLVAAGLAIVIVFLILNINNRLSIKKAKAKKEVTTVAETNDSLEEATNFPEETEITPVVSESIQTVTRDGVKRYYIIAGCFKVPSNADNYVIFLRKKGYPAEKLGIFNGYHVVTFNSFQSRNEAVQALEAIRNDYEAEAWLKKY